jgi:hypothetical protein
MKKELLQSVITEQEIHGLEYDFIQGLVNRVTKKLRTLAKFLPSEAKARLKEHNKDRIGDVLSN